MGRTRAQGRAILAPTAFYGNVGESQASKPVLAGVWREAAAAFGRLCVETSSKRTPELQLVRSRLRAAVC